MLFVILFRKFAFSYQDDDESDDRKYDDSRRNDLYYIHAVIADIFGTDITVYVDDPVTLLFEYDFGKFAGGVEGKFDDHARILVNLL